MSRASTLLLLSAALPVFCAAPPTPPPAQFCGATAQRGMDNPVRLRCDDPSDVIASIPFAAYGTPLTDGPCASWAASSACDVGANASRVVAAACIGHNACAVPTFDLIFDGGVDPCPGQQKWLAVTAQCARGTGVSGGGASCAANGTACPLPVSWSEFNLTLSSVIEPGGDLSPGYFVPTHPFGLISLDWSVANTIWHHANQNESTVEATLTENCRRIKAAFPLTKCFIYGNFELALQAFESNREIMYDPARADWFVRVNGDGAIYNEPGGPGDQFFFNFSTAAVADWYIENAIRLTSDPAVDGVFTDDFEGFPLEHDFGPFNTNTSFAAVAALEFASLEAHGRLIAALAARGKYVWQAMGAGYEGEYVGAGVPHDAAECAAFMRLRCTPAWEARAFMQAFDSGARNQSVAAFLVVRGAVAFLGWGWESGNEAFDEAFLYDVGEPRGHCRETAPGVFARAWTYGDVVLNCTSFAAIIPTAR